MKEFNLLSLPVLLEKGFTKTLGRVAIREHASLMLHAVPPAIRDACARCAPRRRPSWHMAHMAQCTAGLLLESWVYEWLPGKKNKKKAKKKSDTASAYY